MASISAVDGEILGTHNWASHIKYQFIDVPSNSILDGPPRIEDESNIIIPTSSPKGWTFSSTNSADFASTVGNNVVAGTSTFNQGRGNNIRTVQVTDGNFDFPISNKGISSSTVQAAITNMFVVRDSFIFLFLNAILIFIFIYILLMHLHKKEKDFSFIVN